MTTEKLSLITLKGTLRQCGETYGEMFEPRLIGFAHQEVKPDPKRLAYAARCWRYIEKDAPCSAEFMQGVAAGAHLPIEHITLISLHEEICHLPHCTAFLATGEATADRKTYNGQNWDFAATYYPWTTLLRLETGESFHTITYAFPGLWACAGINDAGLSLMWTTTGVLPLVAPEVGIPTYVVIAEILRRRTVAEAVSYIQSVKLAGAFNFMLADAGGCLAAVEALPDYVWVDQSGLTLCRANHYIGDDTARLSEQDISGDERKTFSTKYRRNRMADLLHKYYGKINPEVARQILTDRADEWPFLHQYPEGEAGRESAVLSVDSFFAVSEDRVFHTCRGGRKPGPWQEVAL
jgi:predicted choloylglycine hydrolase